MFFPFRRAVAVVFSTLIFITREVTGSSSSSRSSSRSSSSGSSDCDNNLTESTCNEQWACAWESHDDGTGHCVSSMPTWATVLIVLAGAGCCIFCFCYNRIQRRRRLERAQNNASAGPSVNLQPVPNPVPPTVSNVQPSYAPNNQASNNPQVSYNTTPSYQYGGASAQPPPPGYQYGGASSQPPPPGYYS